MEQENRIDSPWKGEYITGIPECFKTLAHPIWLRDACQCPLCVDPSTKQKLFQTSQIPANIRHARFRYDQSMKRVQVEWENDIPGYPTVHQSTYDLDTLELYKQKPFVVEGLGDSPPYQTWDKEHISKNIQFIDYEECMKNDEALWEVLKQLRQYGLVFIKNVPGENGPAAMGKRVGRLRDTFYGATWDVKSVPQAKNIAYTHQFLGFHMDLLYMADPPGFQMLHCIHNSCKGGESMFTDSFKAVTDMETEDRDRMSHITHFHYKNAGEHYRHGHRTVVYERKSEEDNKEETDLKKYIKYVSYSPPFQAPFAISSGIGNKRSLKTFRLFHRSLTKFQAITEKEENIYEYKMKEGEMVIFNNRRVLHARKAFETGEGERWLKGGYIDTDVVLSKLRVLNAKFTNPKEYAEIMGWAKEPIEELEESSGEEVLKGLEESSEEKPSEELKESS